MQGNGACTATWGANLVAETVIEDDGNGVRSRWCWWWPNGGGLDGGRWLWNPVTTVVLSSSSLCRGAHLWFFFFFSRLLSFYSLSLSLFHLPCPKVFSPFGLFYSSFYLLFLLCSPLFCLLLLLLTVFSAVNQCSSFSATSSWRCWR